ncbi:hypothetical protein [Diaphorobacter sp.]|uniref:hypothetical protein n=1 Tax=Diaphorobacter sp. TaxID=1934310 RepID=UPI002584E43A|nr:hypothetical protein [Diaphorobacter sp.]
MSLLLRKAVVIDVATGLLLVAIMLLIPWELIRGAEFADLRNYLSRIYLLEDYGESYFYWENDLLGWLKFEIIWFKILSLVVDLGVSPDVFFDLITAVSALVAHQFLSRYVGGWWALAILVNPISVDLFSSQLRSAFAFSLILLALMARSQAVRVLLFSVAPFVHAGMAFILAFLFVSWAFVRLVNIGVRVKLFFILVSSVLIAFFVAKYVPQFASEIGDRRDFALFSTKSVAYVAFWFIWIAFLALSVAETLQEDWRIYYTILVGVSASLMDVLGVPGFRFIALSIPILFSAQEFIKKEYKLTVFGAGAMYLVSLYYFWIK